MDTTKTCRVCDQTLPTDQFYPRSDSPDGLRNDCKKCRRSASRRNAAAKPEQYASSHRRWASQNRERLASYKREHYEANRDEYLARAKMWATQNADRRRETYAAWYDRGRLVRLAGGHRYRSRRRQAETLDVSPRDLSRMVARFRGLCAYCKTNPFAAFDHVIPLARGGRHSIGNLLPACTTCNCSKRARLLIEWRGH